jgi:hypothetical protein
MSIAASHDFSKGTAGRDLQIKSITIGIHAWLLRA